MQKRIDKIEFNKPRKRIYTLFFDDGSEQAVHEDTLLKFRLAQGSQIDAALQSKISRFEEETNCKEQAYRFLSRRPHLERELYLKLLHKGYNKALIMSVLDRLRKNNLLDDEDFVRCFAEEEKSLRHSGPLRIKKKLIEKGAPREMVESWLEDHYPETEQLQQAEVLAGKKYNGMQKIDGAKRLQKVRNFLRQRGFTWNIIREVTAQWETEEEL